MGMVGASTSRRQLFVAVVVSGAVFGGLGLWLGGSGSAENADDGAGADEPLSRRGNMIQVVERTEDGGERIVFVERESEDEGRTRTPIRPSYKDIDPDEDYAKYGDGPSANALDPMDVMDAYRAQECLDVGSKCTSDLQCCGTSSCQPPPGSISGIFKCR